MRAQHAVKGTSKGVAMLAQYRDLVADTIRCRFATDNLKRSYATCIRVLRYLAQRDPLTAPAMSIGGPASWSGGGETFAPVV